MDRLRNKISAWILGALFAALIIELVLMAPKGLEVVRETPNSLQEQAKSEAGSAAQTMKGIHVVETKNEKKEWELWAEKAVSPKGIGDLTLDRAKSVFFGEDDVEFEVTGDRGSVTPETKNMQIIGNVVTKSSNGYVFLTDAMEYQSDIRHLSTPSRVSVRGPREPEGGRLKIDGLGMDADLVQAEMRIRSDVRAEKTLVGTRARRIYIKAGEAILSAKNRTLNFEDNVTVDIEGVRVTGPNAKFIYAKTGGQVEAIELTGGIRVSDFDKWATSERVRIDLKKNQFVFNGKPRVVQDEDELFGDEIVFLDGGKKVKVKNARIKVGRETLENQN